MVTNLRRRQRDRATIAGVHHHTEIINERPVHWVSTATSGPPLLLIHGFPETWWAFRDLIPLLATEHRVIAVDLPGFGESTDHRRNTTAGHGSAEAAATLHALVGRLDLGPVHLLGQDIAGNTAFRLATQYPDDVRSLVAVETLVSGFGLEELADVGKGGAWHMGAIATPGVAEFVFTGRVREFLTRMWFPFLTAVGDAVTSTDIDEFERAYSQPGAWEGPRGLYASALHEGDELRRLATSGLHVPVLVVEGMGGGKTAEAMRLLSDRVDAIVLDGVGHHVAMEAPERLAAAMLPFLRTVGQGDS